MQETRVRFLDREDALEKEMATHSCILAWEIPWTEETGELQSMCSQNVRSELASVHRLVVIINFMRKRKPFQRTKWALKGVKISYSVVKEEFLRWYMSTYLNDEKTQGKSFPDRRTEHNNNSQNIGKVGMFEQQEASK